MIEYQPLGFLCDLEPISADRRCAPKESAEGQHDDKLQKLENVLSRTFPWHQRDCPGAGEPGCGLHRYGAASGSAAAA